MSLTHKQYLFWPHEHFYVYILINEFDQYYIGVTHDRIGRLKTHKKKGTLKGDIEMKYSRYAGNLWRAYNIESALKKQANPLSIISDESLFTDFCLRLPTFDFDCKSPNVRMMYSNAVGILQTPPSRSDDAGGSAIYT